MVQTFHIPRNIDSHGRIGVMPSAPLFHTAQNEDGRSERLGEAAATDNTILLHDMASITQTIVDELAPAASGSEVETHP